jgi:putative peptide zinc metalloprotease protein
VAPSVWLRLQERLDPLQLRPTLRPDIVIRALETRDHQPYYMAKSPRAGTYIRLSPRERDLLVLMDGEHTVKQIVLADFAAHKSLAFKRVIQLVMLLQAQSFLVDRLVPTYALLQQRLRTRGGPREWATRVAALLLQSEITLRGIDPFVTALYRSIGWILLSRPGLLVLAVIAIAGLLVFQLGAVQSTPLPRLLTGDHGLPVGLAYGLFLVLSILLHELGHALTCKAFGGEIRRGGFKLLFGFPVFYVDTTDSWMQPRFQRVAVSAAGVAVDTVVAGGCALLALVLPPELATVSLALATTSYVVVLFNLFPLLELDGYYILLDLLETANLRPRSLAFIRESLPRKLWQRESFSRDELILAVYGLLSAAFAGFFLLKALSFWDSALTGLVKEAFEGGNRLLIGLAVLFTGVILGVLALKVARLTHSAAGLAGRGAHYLLRAAEHARLRPRGRLLEGVPVLAELPPAQLDAIAAALRPRRYAAGSAVMRQGEPGDRYCLIVRGAAEVVRADQGRDPALVATLGPGDYFGELALLNQAPRAATVRALTSLDVYELTAQAFKQLVSPTWQLRERMGQAVQLRLNLAAMPLFSGLGPAERDLLMSRVREDEVEAGQEIIHQREAGDRFYIVREGQVRVLREEGEEAAREIAILGPGEFFGELALLYAAPRNATVVALTTVRLWSLDRRDFDDVLRHYLRLDETIQATARQRIVPDLEAVRPVPTGAGDCRGERVDVA